MDDDKPAKRGRPSGLTAERIKQAEKLAKLGATDMEIADFFEVSTRSILRWKAESVPFCHALKVGKEPADDRVERSLFARALGYEHEETDIRVVSGEIVMTPIRKVYPPDTVACIFWLKNRRPDLWREKREEEGASAEDAAKAAQEAIAAAMGTIGSPL